MGFAVHVWVHEKQDTSAPHMKRLWLGSQLRKNLMYSLHYNGTWLISEFSLLITLWLCLMGANLTGTMQLNSYYITTTGGHIRWPVTGKMHHKGSIFTMMKCLKERRKVKKGKSVT
jgi:hypothetical protein